MASAPLDGVRVIEAAGWNGVLAGRLLADGGADVVRLVPAGGDPLASEPPYFAEGGRSVQEAWYNAGKSVVSAEAVELGEYLSAADILVDDGSMPNVAARAADCRYLVHVRVSPFGSSGPWAAYRTTDLVANALCGSASVTGDASTPPLSGYGNQSHHTVGLYAAVCALAGLRYVRASGRGISIDLSAHEALVTCTEQVLMQWFFPKGGNWKTQVAQRTGSLHWSGAYQVYPARDGRGVMVTASLKPVEVLLPWLHETGDDEDLTDPQKYPNVIALVKDLPHVMDVLKGWVAKQEADELFFEAQRRHQPFGAVKRISEVAASPQVAARKFVQPVDLPGAGPVPFPGRLFRTDRDEGHPAPSRNHPPGAADWAPGEASRDGAANELSPGQPLAGIRVLDFTHVLAGPFGTRILGDLGADVIKVGSASRGGGANSTAHPYYVSWNRNKRSIALNMAAESGRQVARRLAANCDVVIDNFSAGVMERWGLGHDAVARDNPRITSIAMGGMGKNGPWSDFVTYAPTIHALVGLTYLTGVPGRDDIGYGFSLTDHLSGLAAAVAALEGVEHARRTGEGLEVDLAQYELGLGIMGVPLLDYLANGRDPEPVGNRHPYGACAPHGIYPCQGDDRWIALACLDDAQWEAARAILGLPVDPRFSQRRGRIERQDELDAAVAGATATWDRYALMASLQAAGIPAGAVQDAEDLATRDDQLAHSGFYGTASCERWPEYGIDRFPALFDGARPDACAGPVELGVDTFAVLNEILGLSDEDIAALMAEGALT